MKLIGTGVDAQALYRELKEVENPGRMGGLIYPTDLMQRRLNLWLKMPRLYQGFHQRLAAEGLGDAWRAVPLCRERW